MALFMQLLFSGLAIGSVYALIGLGYSLIYKASGLMTFVQGDLLTLGAFLGLTFYRILELPFVVSVLLTCVVSFALGFLLERAVIRRLLKKNVMLIYIVLATIAVSYIVQNGCQLIWGSMAQFFPFHLGYLWCKNLRCQYHDGIHLGIGYWTFNDVPAAFVYV